MIADNKKSITIDGLFDTRVTSSIIDSRLFTPEKLQKSLYETN